MSLLAMPATAIDHKQYSTSFRRSARSLDQLPNLRASMHLATELSSVFCHRYWFHRTQGGLIRKPRVERDGEMP